MLLKSLRPAVGIYGTVPKGGVVEVDEATGKKLLKTGRFVQATEADIDDAAAREIGRVATASGADADTVDAGTDKDDADTVDAGTDKDDADTVDAGTDIGNADKGKAQKK
ncbi:hypothetical protein ACEYYA_00910 [Paracoccus sp. p3-h83]|uniref:hypothetical protein n=1 Tax=Paracoccus sp. p3-h83 TaxID=3342805 RepID=UPI0035B8AE47